MVLEKKYNHGYSVLDFIRYVCRQPDPNIDYNQFVNKGLVKDIIGSVMPVARLFHHIHTIKDFDEINFHDLPNQFMIKACHGAAMGELINKKKNFDKDHLRHMCQKWLNTNYYGPDVDGEELHYSTVDKGVIIEECLEGILEEYKFWVCEGEWYLCTIQKFLSYRPKIVGTTPIINGWKLLSKRQSGWIKNFGAHKWVEFPLPPESVQKECERLIPQLYKVLGDVPFVRIDLMNVRGVIYFGEFTFTPGGGEANAIGGLTIPYVDNWLGSLIDLQIPQHKMREGLFEWMGSLDPSSKAKVREMTKRIKRRLKC